MLKRHRTKTKAALAVLSAALLCAALPLASAQAAPPVTIASPGEGPGKVESPQGTAVYQSTGELYVAEDGNGGRISKFDSEGNFLLAWGWGVADGVSQEFQVCGPAVGHPRCFRGSNNTATGAGAIRPEAVAVEQSSGDVYAVDRRNRRVTKFGPEGEFLFMVGKGVDQGGGFPENPGDICTAEYLEDGDVCGKGEAGAGAGEFFDSPVSATVDSAGNLWVGDTGRVIQFDPAGAYVSEAEVAAGAGATKGLDIDPVSGDFYIKSASKSGVRRYEPEGSPIGELTEVTGPGLPLDDAGQPEALVVDSAGNVYVGDKTSPYRFLRFNPSAEQTSQFGAGQVLGSPGQSGISASGSNPLALDETAGYLYSASSRFSADSFVQRFSVPEPGPLIEAQRAEDLEPTGATLAASLNPEGAETTYHFEYGTDESYGSETPTETLAAEGFEAEDVEAAIGELIPDTTYHFRLVASNECEPAVTCTVEGPDTTFTTRPAVAIEAQWATDVAARSASLRAQIDPLGVEAQWWIEYGTSAAYGNSTEDEEAILPASFGAIEVGVALSGLAPDTTYHYRFLAKDEREGTTYLVEGADRTFTTQTGGLGFSLADDRVWEMVTPANKHSGVLRPAGEGQIQAAADGEAIALLSLNSLVADPEGSRAPELASTVARREGTGEWGATDIVAPNADYFPLSVGLGTEYVLYSSDLSRALLEPINTAPLSPQASERTPYVRTVTAPPTFTPLVTGKEGFANVPSGTVFGATSAGSRAVRTRGATADLGHVLLNSAVPLKTGDANGGLYQWLEGRPPAEQLRRISVLPGEEAAVAGDVASGQGSGSLRNAFSADGARVFWTTGGGLSCGEETSGLFLRDAEREESVQLDEVKPGAFGTGGSSPRFQGASADGSVAFFTDTCNLTPDANESGADLYRCEVTTAGGELGCELSDLTAATASPTEAADVLGFAGGVSEDGSRIYFVARGVLDESPNGLGESAASGQPNLYLWQQGEGVRFIATLAEQETPSWGRRWDGALSLYFLATQASPSGRYLAFMSRRGLTGYDNRDATGGEPLQEAFRYDAVADELICASCNPGGARPAGLPGPGVFELARFFDPLRLWEGEPLAATLPEAMRQQTARDEMTYYRPRAVHDNGRLFFNAADSLVAADSNGNWDVYQYESTGTGTCTVSSGDAGTARSGEGCVSLISSGTGTEEAAFLDASVGGEDAFFVTPARLAATDEDSVMDVYDARVGGVAASVTPRSECLGEACQPAASPPDAQTPASTAFRGPGNLAQPRECRPPARRAGKLSKRAKRLRRNAGAAQRNGKRGLARKRNRKAKRLAGKARKLSANAKRCRRANRRAGK